MSIPAGPQGPESEADARRRLAQTARTIAAAQRESVMLLSEAVSGMREGGMTWQEIAAVLGMNQFTLLKQFYGGSGVLVVRVRHGAKAIPDPEEEDSV